MERKISGISEFPEKKDNLERLTAIFEKIFRKFCVPFDFEPEFSEILVEWKAPIETAAMLVYQTKPLGTELHFHANFCFCCMKLT